MNSAQGESSSKYLSFSNFNSVLSIDVDSAAELTNMVQTMLSQMQTRFGEMNKNIVDRIDTMGSKIDDLETSIKELVQEANESQNPQQKWVNSQRLLLDHK